MIYWSVLV